MKTIKLIALGTIACSLFLTSCKKEETDTDTGTVSSENNSTSELMFNHIFDATNTEMNEAEQKEGLNTAKTDLNLSIAKKDTCATITYTLSSDKKYIETMTLDYGNGGCIFNGRERKGKIKIHSTGKIKAKGTVLTITPENFYIDGYKVEGTKTVTSNGIDLQTLSISHDIVVKNGKITAPNGKTFQWNATRTTTIKIVNNTIEAHYTGSAQGVNQNGIPFTITIDKTLIAKAGCKHFVSGVLTVKPNGFKTRSLDYGNGTCDNAATVTIGGTTTKQITLK